MKSDAHFVAVENKQKAHKPFVAIVNSIRPRNDRHNDQRKEVGKCMYIVHAADSSTQI